MPNDLGCVPGLARLPRYQDARTGASSSAPAAAAPGRNLGESRFAWEQEDLHPGPQVRIQLGRPLIDLRIAPDNRPSVAAGPGKPVRISRSLGGFPAPVKPRGRVHRVTRFLKPTSHGSSGDILVEVELRRRGPGGRGRRSGRRRVRLRAHPLPPVGPRQRPACSPRPAPGRGCLRRSAARTHGKGR